MAYSGTTSTSPNPPTLLSQAIAGPRSWIYRSTHTAATASAANFFTDGLELGFKVGDPVVVLEMTTTESSAVTAVTSHAVTAVGATTTQLSTGSLYSS